ncbi:NUDIX hydrolase [Nocardia puris]|uniref:NUDIX hydrolase n=1 Tax=Nocardia puris TaxID=208602 RepID=UPI00189448C2|nr:NUDIX hydrolase [Nocardia puris]MBF6370356.1 NUDIX hydrolase [Nocardia puris]
MDSSGWPLISREYPFTYKLGRIRRDRILGRDGAEHTHTIIENVGAVYVIPLTHDGNIVLLQQYRQSLQQWMWELPAGSRHDHTGPLAELAAQELLQEAGATAASFEHLGFFQDSVPIADSRCDFYLAHDTVIDRPQFLGRTELITRHQVPIETALNMARTGEISDARSALCLLRAAELMPTGCHVPTNDFASRHPANDPADTSHTADS